MTTRNFTSGLELAPLNPTELENGPGVEATSTTIHQMYTNATILYDALKSGEYQLPNPNWVVHHNIPGTNDTIEIGVSDSLIADALRMQSMVDGLRDPLVRLTVRKHQSIVGENDSFLRSETELTARASGDASIFAKLSNIEINFKSPTFSPEARTVPHSPTNHELDLMDVALRQVIAPGKDVGPRRRIVADRIAHLFTKH